MLTIVSYDIIDDTKRTKLAKTLLNFGKRVQYSVFECDLQPDKIEAMKNSALKLVDLEKDSLRIYRICQTCVSQIESYGIKKGWEEEEIIVIG